MGLGFQEVAPARPLHPANRFFKASRSTSVKHLHLLAGGLDAGGVAGHGPHGAGRLFREVVVGQPGLGPDGQGLFDLPQGHLAHQGGFAVRRRHLRHGGGDGRQVRHQLRGGDDDGPVHLVILKHRVQGHPVAVLPAVPQDVHRVVDIGRGRQPLAQLFHGGVLQRRRSPGRSAPRRPRP